MSSLRLAERKLLARTLTHQQKGRFSAQRKTTARYSAACASIIAGSPVSAGALGLMAWVLNQPGATYAWTISGGTITSGLGSR